MGKRSGATGTSGTGGGVTRQTGAATRVKGSGAQVKSPLNKGAAGGGKPWVSTPKRVVDRTSANKVDNGGGKKVTS